MQKTRSRAAVLCFGGWGLQTMLHLWPRLRFIQEERWALGIDRQLPDLGRLAAFAAIMPQPMMSANSQNYQPFRLMRPFADVYPAPFFVEQQLAQIEQQLADEDQERRQSGTLEAPLLTYSERVAAALLEQASGEGYITEIGIKPPTLATKPPPDERVSRQTMFQMGIEWAETAARSIVRYVIDPTRLDNVQTRDPLVQTSIYVVASLCEPLASALIWPILSELHGLLGKRHVVNVVGLFATGSFAIDDTRAIEDAAAHLALMEIEGFDGYDLEKQAELEYVVTNNAKSGWRDRLRTRHFHHIYLIDREKTNQALAASSVELSVLTGNAVEALLVADGMGHIEQQLGATLRNNTQAHYSLLGAANDYVPFAHYIYAAMHAEQQRLIRELVLTRPGDAAQLSLRELGLLPEQALRRLITPQNQRMFIEATTTRPRRFTPRRWIRRRTQRNASAAAQASPEQLPEFRITQNYLLPQNIRERLRQAHGLWEWRQVVEQRLTAVAEMLAQTIDNQQLEEGWGLHYDALPVNAHPQAVRSLYTRKTWTARRQDDKRTAPAAIAAVVQELVRQTCSDLHGISTSEAQLSAWLDQVEAQMSARRSEQTEFQQFEANEQYGQRVQSWQHQFLRVAGRQPARVAHWTRVGLLGIFISYLAISWLLFESQMLVTPQLLALITSLCVGLTLLVGGVPLALERWRIGRIKQRRINLAIERLSQNLNQQIQDSLQRLYERVQGDLSSLHRPLRRAVANLREWATSEDPTEIPPLGVEPIHLRQAHTSYTIWQRIQELIREKTLDGMSSQERLRQSWHISQLPQNWMETGAELVQRVRLAYELPLNQQELTGLVQLEAQRRGAAQPAPAAAPVAASAAPAAPSPAAAPVAAPAAPAPLPDAGDPSQAVLADLQGGAWCGYSPEPPTQRPAPSCTACPNLDKYRCPFSAEGATSSTHWSLDALVQDHVRQATEHVINRARMLPDFTSTLINEYQLEQLLLRQQGLTNGHEKEFQRDFIEDIHARAKPAGNFDVADTFSSAMLEIDFGVTADSSRSSFAGLFSQQNMSLLSSHDPMSITMVRIVARLMLHDLALHERSCLEYHRLHDADRALLTIGAQPTQPGDITYEQIMGAP